MNATGKMSWKEARLIWLDVDGQDKGPIQNI